MPINLRQDPWLNDPNPDALPVDPIKTLEVLGGQRGFYDQLPDVHGGFVITAPDRLLFPLVPYIECADRKPGEFEPLHGIDCVQFRSTESPYFMHVLFLGGSLITDRCVNEWVARYAGQDGNSARDILEEIANDENHAVFHVAADELAHTYANADEIPAERECGGLYVVGSYYYVPLARVRDLVNSVIGSKFQKSRLAGEALDEMDRDVQNGGCGCNGCRHAAETYNKRKFYPEFRLPGVEFSTNLLADREQAASTARSEGANGASTTLNAESDSGSNVTSLSEARKRSVEVPQSSSAKH